MYGTVGWMVVGAPQEWDVQFQVTSQVYGESECNVLLHGWLFERDAQDLLAARSGWSFQSRVGVCVTLNVIHCLIFVCLFQFVLVVLIVNKLSVER
jgi:hypothetical protein